MKKIICIAVCFVLILVLICVIIAINLNDEQPHAKPDNNGSHTKTETLPSILPNYEENSTKILPYDSYYINRLVSSNNDC